MVPMVDFPLEILQKTIAALSGDFISLGNGAITTGEAKQKLLFSLIAENSKIAKCINTFSNNSTGVSDATNKCEKAILVDAARKMTHLRRAYLGKNVLSAIIITSIHSYPELVDLVVHGLNPGWFIWTQRPTNLRSLTWTEPVPRGEEYPHNYEGGSLQYLINVIESTCPLLESLNLHFEPGERLSKAYSDDLRFLRNRPERSILYIERSGCIDPPNRAIPRLALDRLQHFGLRDAYGMQHQYMYTELMQKFVRDHEQTIKSLLIPIGTIRTEKELDFILSMSEDMLNLKELALLSDGSWETEPMIEAERFLSVLVTNLAPPGNFIERFTMMDIGTYFSKEIAQIFCSWKALKFLHLGDSDNTNGPYDDDGRINLDTYDLITFIKELPSSLEELVLDINGEGLFFAGDFDKTCHIGNSIFTSLKRLKSCDLCIWISGIKMTVKEMPEKAIHWRRLPHIGRAGNQKLNMRMKDIWTSRMEFNIADGQCSITHECASTRLGDSDGYFEGDDAGGVWLDSTKYQRHTRDAYTRHRREFKITEVAKSWPIRQENLKFHALYSRSLRRNPYGPVC